MNLLEKVNENIPRTEKEKQQMIKLAAMHYGDFLLALGFDWTKDENSANTPMRVAKSWMNDLVKGCVEEGPDITTFPSNNYKGIVFEGDIEVVSMCSHHNLAFTGKAYIAYIAGERVIGLSKLNRMVDWYARRPQIQEGLTQQIHDKLEEVLVGNKGIAVMIEAKHTCCSHRGIKHKSTMITASVSGLFHENKDGCKDEFYKFVDKLK